jgi:hypothetical protein
MHDSNTPRNQNCQQDTPLIQQRFFVAPMKISVPGTMETGCFLNSMHFLPLLLLPNLEYQGSCTSHAYPFEGGGDVGGAETGAAVCVFWNKSGKPSSSHWSRRPPGTFTLRHR